MNSILTELKRRNVLKIGIAYLAVGWLLISIGDILLPLLDMPDWVFKILALVIAIGLPIVAIFAWLFELTPEGVKLEKDIDRSQSITTQTGRKLDYIVIAMLIAALSVSVYLNFWGEGGVGIVASQPDYRKSIAVLPFSNRSTDPENALFADGIHDDLLTNLAHIGALKVISRTSVMKYRDTTKNLRQIGEELNVATVLEGAVQRVANNVRINVQLIDAKTDEHLWANSYDRELTTQNIFKIQSEISKDISSELQATLTPIEQSRLEIIPTDNLAAYNLYRAGRHNVEERRLETLELARTQFEQAIELDPNYSQAYSGLADSILLLRINHNALPVEEAYPLVQQALDRALALDLENADAYASLGLLKLDMWGMTRTGPEIDEAESAFQKAIELNPNHARAVMWYASMQGAQQKLDEAISLYHRSLELDPLARIPYSNLPGLYAQQGHNQKALDEWLEAARLHPTWPVPFQNIAAHLQRLGRIDESIAWADKANELDTDPLAGGISIVSYLVFGEKDKSIEYIDAIPENHPLHEIAVIFKLFVNGDYAGVIAVMESLIVEGANPPQFALDIVSDAALLIDDLDTARKFVVLQQPVLADDPIGNVDQFNAHNLIKLAYIARLEGDPTFADELLEAALPVVESVPRLGVAGHGIRDVQILALMGRSEEALARLREAIDAGFCCASIYDNWSLDTDPYLAAIRDDPKYLAMVEEIKIKLDEMHESTLRAEASGDWDQLRSLAQTEPVNPAAVRN